jgi:hypothetical protein
MAEEALEEVAAECPMAVEKIDITTDSSLFERYQYEIPVIVVEGGGTISGRIGLAEVRRVLRLPPLPSGKGSQARGNQP